MAALFLCPLFLSYCSVLRGIPSFLLCLGCPKNGGQYMLGVFTGYTWGIRGVFMGYSYVSGMCRVCIGYVSGKYRRGWGAWGAMDETEKGI